MMKLVRLIAPSERSCTLRSYDGKDYAVAADGTVDVPESMVRDLLAEGFRRASASELVLMQGPQGIEGKQGEVGPQGPPGPRGPIGPMPRHEWEGTELRFEIAPGQWGAWVDLQGPKGEPGRDGAVTGGGIFGAGPLDLSALSVATSVNSYMPAGW
jgi:hypothetical protein